MKKTDRNVILKREILNLIKKRGGHKLPREWRFSSELFDIGSAENANRTPQLLYTHKKSSDEIRRTTLAAPFQPVVEFELSKIGGGGGGAMIG